MPVTFKEIPLWIAYMAVGLVGLVSELVLRSADYVCEQAESLQFRIWHKAHPDG